MTRFPALILGLFLTLVPVTAQKQQKGAQQEPQEEDEALKPKEYSFNPLQADKEVVVGNFYLKKGRPQAAAGRFREATKWNPGLAEAWLRLGDAEEKLKDHKAAREAWAKFAELAPEDKRTPGVRKKLGAKP